MLTIVAHFPQGKEVVDWFLTNGEADDALPQYKQALKVPCEIGRTRGHRDVPYDKLMELRNAGATAGEIELALPDLNRFAIDHFTAKLAAEGLIESRKGHGGWKRKPGMSERDEIALGMMRDGKGPKEIHVALGIKYYTARSIVQRLRKRLNG